jgi:hypothetical protein
MSALAVPYRKKSYHSMVVPMKLAIATLRIDASVDADVFKAGKSPFG